MRITFLGAAREVTGSLYLVETPKSRFLVDCGLFQGSRLAEPKNHEPFSFNPAELDFVVISHAHLDHTGRLPRLVAEGFRGPIFATSLTRKLAELILLDAANLVRRESRFHRTPPLFTKADVAAALNQFVHLRYNEPRSAGDVTVTLRNSGHILGSAFVIVEAEGRKTVFSSDLGNFPGPIMPFPEALPPGVTTLILESTYGGRVHEGSQSRRAKLESVVDEVVARRGTLLIPSFAVERAQEILFDLDELMAEKRIPAIPVFFDSPLAIKVLETYRQHIGSLNTEAQRRASTGEDVFRFDSLTLTPRLSDSRQISTVPPPKIIIAGSGMMQGGRIVEHAAALLSDPRTFLLVVGFMAEGSLGRRLFEGETEVRIHGKPVHVRATVKGIGAYSAHADQPTMIEWITAAPTIPKKILLTHGEPLMQEQLARALSDAFPGTAVEIPAPHDSLEV